jgi:hypothetical protein
MSEGDISLSERKRSEIMNGDELIISVNRLHSEGAEFRLVGTVQ